MPLIPIGAIEPDDENSWVLVNNSRFLVDGKYLLGGTQQYQTNPFAAMYAAGYSKWTSRQLQFDAGVRIGLDKITPGLRFVVRGAVDYNTSYSTSINNTYATYQASWSNYGGKDVDSRHNQVWQRSQLGRAEHQRLGRASDTHVLRTV